MDDLKFSGYDPKPVMEAKLNKMLELIKELQLKVAKLKLPAQPATNTAKVAKTEE